MNKLLAYKKDIINVMLLSIPLIMVKMSNYGKAIVDSVLVGNIDEFNLAGMSLALSVYFLIVLCISSILSYSTTVYSGYIAKNNLPRLQKYVFQAMYINAFLTIIACIIFYNSDIIFSFFDLDQRTKDIAVAYLRVMAYAHPLMGLIYLIRPILNAFGDNKIIARVTVFTFFVNALLSYVLIYTYNMGAVGGAVATAVCQIFESAVFYCYLVNKRSIHLFKNCSKISYFKMHKILRQGIPFALATFSTRSYFSFILFLVAVFGEVTLSAHHIVLNVTGFMAMFSAGFDIVAAQKMGYFMGAKDFDSNKRFAIATILATIIIAIVTVIITAIFRSHIASIYTDNQDIINIASSIMILGVLYLLLEHISATLKSMLKPLKRSSFSLAATIFSYWIIGLPVSLMLASTYGVYAYWVGFILAEILNISLLSYKVYSMLNKLDKMGEMVYSKS